MKTHFKHTGSARDFGGTYGEHYESDNWIICIWKTFSHSSILLQGSLENMNGCVYHFALHNNSTVTYSRVLESNYNGLGKQYNEFDSLVPKYVINKIKDIAAENQQS